MNTVFPVFTYFASEIILANELQEEKTAISQYYRYPKMRKGVTMEITKSAIIWENDYDKGLKLSQDEKRPVFLDFFKEG